MEIEKEKALIVAVNIKNDDNFEKSVEELFALCEACNIEPVDKVTQNLNEINPAFYIGTGKIDEVKKAVNMYGVDVVIFNNELSHSQLRNLQKHIDTPILDRTSLILQIFALRARTNEAKIQVEVAKLEYMLPRLVGLHSSLGRQGGSAGVSNKGSGEKKLELDRRKIEEEIVRLNKELKQIEKQREVMRKNRKKNNIPIVALAGYTNAGKSTLLNSFVVKYKTENAKKVEEKDMLFATLETSVRNIKLEDKKEFLLSDTVGFISNLPHNLIKAFRSTLEEIKQADLILEVVDYSDENYKKHIEVTNNTLKEIGAGDIPIVYVFNKCDKVLSKIPLVEGNNIYISAKNMIGIDMLTNLIKSKIFENYTLSSFLFPFERGDILSYFNKNARILNVEYTENGTIIDVECKEEDYMKYKGYEYFKN